MKQHTRTDPSLCLALLALALGCGLPSLAAASAAGALAPSNTVQTCNWDRPGLNPFVGDVVAAVDHYRDMPADVRERLKTRMANRQYDDIVSIRRDSITGRGQYSNTIGDMHFGANQVCRSVTRAAWTEAMQERGLVYCEGRQCILVPTVCRNVSRILRAAVDHERAEGPEDALPPVAALPPETLFATAGPASAAEPASFAAQSGSDRADGAAGAGDGAGTGFGPPGLFAGGGGGGGGGGSIGSGPAPAADGQPPVNIDVEGTVTPVPEPETWSLLLAGAAVAAAWKRRRAARSSAAGSTMKPEPTDQSR